MACPFSFSSMSSSFLSNSGGSFFLFCCSYSTLVNVHIPIFLAVIKIREYGATALLPCSLIPAPDPLHL